MKAGSMAGSSGLETCRVTPRERPLASGHEEVWHSKLASRLLQQWAWGEMTAPLLQQLASAAVAHGALHLELASLSKLGHNGQCPGNCHRDLQRYLSGNHTTSVPVNMAITLGISGDRVDTELPLMPLHRVWSCMFEQRKDVFDIRVRGGRRGHQ